MNVGYVRVSKREQNPELPRWELEAAGCERIFEKRDSSHEQIARSCWRRSTTAGGHRAGGVEARLVREVKQRIIGVVNKLKDRRSPGFGRTL